MESGTLTFFSALKTTVIKLLILFAAVSAHAQEIGVTFEEDFESASSLERFDFAIHHPVLFKEPIRIWKGDHSLDCGPPPTTRDIQLPGDRRPGDGKIYDLDTEQAVYWCAPGGVGSGHLMTTFNTNGYAQIDFTPSQIFNDVRKVCWDQNMTDLGSRKWTQLVVVGMDTFIENDQRLDYVSPRIEDGPGSAATRLSGDTFMLEVIGGSSVVHTGRNSDANFRGYRNTDKRRRFTVCATDLENGVIEIEFERESTVEIRQLDGAMPNGPARVIFQDDTYNAPKSPPRLNVPDPFTWHWDNIRVFSVLGPEIPTPSRGYLPTMLILLDDEEPVESDDEDEDER